MADPQNPNFKSSSDDLLLPDLRPGHDPAPIGQQFKYCPMCTTPLVYRPLFGRQRQQCPACEWIHFQDPKVGAGVMVEQKGQILLGRRGVDPGRGLWCIPSGFVEIDESPEAAAVREYKEETGLDIQLTGLFDIFHFHSAVKGAGILILYSGRIIGGTPRPMDDLVELTFYAPAGLPADDEIAFASNRQALQRWQNEKNIRA